MKQFLYFIDDIVPASNVFVYTKTTCVARTCWAQPKPIVLHRADAGLRVFAKRSFSTPQECTAITEP